MQKYMQVTYKTNPNPNINHIISACSQLIL